MLVSTIEILNKSLPTSINIEYNRIKPFLKVAENKYLKEILGLTFLAKLNAFNGSSAQNNSYMTDVLELAQQAETYLAFYEGFDVLNVSIKDSGFFRIEDDKRKSLFNYQERNLREYFSSTGYNTLDDILEYMEENISEFGDWRESAAYTNQHLYIINSAKRFTEIYSKLYNSRLVFLNLLSDLKVSEDFDIKPVIGTDLFEKLKELIIDNDIEKITYLEYKKLLPYVQNPLAYFTIARASKNIGANFNDKGLFFASYTNTDKNFKIETQDSDKIKMLVESAENNARQYIDALETYLKANILKIPEYADFIGDDTDDFDPAFDNTDKKIIRM